MNNSSEEQRVKQSMSDYAEQSSTLAHSILVKLEGAKEININPKQSISLASDLSHMWASCKMMDKQIQSLCSTEKDFDESNLIEMLTNIEHVYSHALTSMSILSKMMSVNSIITETES